MDRSPFSTSSRGDLPPVKVKLGVTPSPFMALNRRSPGPIRTVSVRRTPPSVFLTHRLSPIAERRAELFEHVKTVVASSKLHSLTSSERKIVRSRSPQAPIRFLKLKTTQHVSPPVTPTPMRETATTVHKSLQTLTHVSQNTVVSTTFCTPLVNNGRKFALSTYQENMPRNSTSTELVRTGAVVTTECLDCTVDAAENKSSISKLTTVHRGDERMSTFGHPVDSDRVDNLTTNNTNIAEGCFVRSQVVAGGESMESTAPSEILICDEHQQNGFTDGITNLESAQEPWPDCIIAGVADVESHLATASVDTGSVGHFENCKSIDQVSSLPELDERTEMKNVEQSTESIPESLTSQKSTDAKTEREDKLSEAAKTVTPIPTSNTSQSRNIFGPVRHLLKIVLILHVFAIICEAQKHYKAAHNRRARAAIIRTLFNELHALSHPFTGSIGDRLDKVKHEFETEVANANRKPKVVWNRLAAELVFNFKKADLPSKLNPFARTLQLVASLSPTSTQRASYLGYAKTGVQRVINALSPTRRAQSAGIQAPPMRLLSRRGSDLFYGSLTKNAVYLDLQLCLLACIQEELKHRKMQTPTTPTTPAGPVRKRNNKFVEQPSLLSSDPATPDVPNQPWDLVDSSPMLDSQQPKPVRLLSSSAQEESRPLFPISPSTDSDDVCLIIRDRLQEALGSALFKPPAQDDDLSVNDDAQAVSDEFSTTSPSSQPDPRQETAFHTQRFLQWESSSTRPPLFGPESGIEVSSTSLSEVLLSTPVRSGTEWENLRLAVAEPIDEQVTPEFQTAIVQTPSGPVECTAAIEVNAKPKQRDSDKDIAAAKMRMAEIFNCAKLSFSHVNSKAEPTNLRTVTPIGAVTSSIKYLVANTKDAVKARHNWDLAVLTARTCALSARPTTWSAVARESQLRKLVIDVSKLRSGLRVRRDLRTAATRPPVSRNRVFRSWNEERKVSVRSIATSIGMVPHSSGLTRRVLQALPSEYQQHQQDSKNNAEPSEDEEDRRKKLSTGVSGDEGEDSVDSELSKDITLNPFQIINHSGATETLSASHRVGLLPIANGRSSRGSNTNNLAYEEEEDHPYILGSERSQDAQAPDAQGALYSDFSSYAIATSLDSKIQLTEVFCCDKQRETFGLTDQIRSSPTDNKADGEESSQPNDQFRDDRLSLPANEYEEDKSHTSRASSYIEYIASAADDLDIEHIASLLENQNCQQDHVIGKAAEGDNSVQDDDASLDGNELLDCQVETFEIVDTDSSRMLVFPEAPNTDISMTALDEVASLLRSDADAPTPQIWAVQNSHMETGPNGEVLDALSQHSVLSVSQAEPTPQPRAARHAIQITHMNSDWQIVRYVEVPPETTILDCVPATDDQLRDIEVLFCKSLWLLVAQYEMKTGLADQGERRTLLVQTARNTNNTRFAEPSHGADGNTGQVPGAEIDSRNVQSTIGKRTTRCLVGLLLFVTMLMSMICVCGWFSYNFLVLMAEVWEFLDRGMWCYLSPRQRVELLDEIYFKRKRNFYLMARFVVANMKEYFGPQPRTFVT